MLGPSTDQISVFLAVVDHGSFIAAAKSLRRAQSAVTYAIKRMEEQLGVSLFDRTEYRAVLTDAGRALVPNARRITDGVVALRTQALSLAEGHEAEISLVVDSIYPMQRVREALHGFSQVFPAIPTQLYVQSYAHALQLLVDDVCTIGVINENSCATAPIPLVTRAVGAIELVTVVAPSHPLAAFGGLIAVEEMQDHIRLVLGEGAPAAVTRVTRGYYGSLWFVNDIAAKRELLLTGVGWGIMPLHLVEQDLAEGRLQRIEPEKSDYPASRRPGEPHLVPMFCAHRSGRIPGPASRWLIDYLAS
jgi:DNA-binding transcriptional LysR family regulator